MLQYIGREWSGLDSRVYCIEPSEFALQLRRLASVLVEQATVEAAKSIPDNTCALAVAAQAFHWFATPGALRSIRRTLRHGAPLALVWNTRDERTEWVAALEHLISEYVCLNGQ